MDNQAYLIKAKRLETLLRQLTDKGKLNAKQQAELDLLSDKIAAYEELHYPFKVNSLTEMIELRMYQRKLKQKDLAHILGTTPSRISEILKGKKGLTLELARRMYQKLNIDADLILGESDKWG